jgi:hypothetical protein
MASVYSTPQPQLAMRRAIPMSAGMMFTQMYSKTQARFQVPAVRDFAA